ncbi:MAG TPA: hypothetical protein VMF08_22265 [Candidatus Sulfotelmatobacter sp.]|nr:hypothetical protein [Candidatus Sulfotelmatobacter sp.]
MRICSVILVLLSIRCAFCADTNYGVNAKCELFKLRQEFAARTAGLNRRSKDWPKVQQETIESLLDSCSRPVRGMIFQDFVSHPETNSPPLFFDSWLAQAFVIRIVESNEVLSLPQLLATHCPEHVGALTLEWYLVYEKGPDAVPVLASSYFLSGTNYSSMVLLNCFNRAFPSLRRENMTDAEFVKACVQWIKLNAASSTLNYKYHRMNAPELEWDTPLFLPIKNATVKPKP